MGVVRNLRDHWAFRTGIHARLAYEIFGACLGLGAIALEGIGTTPLAIGGGVVSLLSAGMLVRDVGEKMRRSQNTTVAPNPKFAETIDAATLPDGFERITTDAGRYIVSAEVNEALEDSASAIAWTKKPFAVPEQVADYRERAVNLMQPSFNEDKVRLQTDMTALRLQGRKTMRIQHTDYFKGVATNEMATRQFEALNKGRRGRAQVLFAPVDLIVTEDGKLRDLSESALSNHIGVTSLLITADHQIVLQQQGKQMVGALKLSVGASGSLDGADAYDVNAKKKRVLRTFQDMVRRGMEREASEEVSAAVGPEKSRTWLTGYARYLDRGAKPEFYGITRTISELDELHAGKNEADFVHQIYGRPFQPSAAGLTAVIDTLLAEGAQNASLSLIVCLRFAKDYLARGGAIEF